MTYVIHISIHHGPLDPRIFHKEAVTLASNGYQITYFADGNQRFKKTVFK
jgi:hypothetical protein